VCAISLGRERWWCRWLRSFFAQGALNLAGLLCRSFARLNDSVRSKRPIETTVLHEHRVQFRGSPYSPTTEPTLDLCANPAAIIGVLPLALIAARYWILHIFGKGAGRSSGLHTQSALLRGPEPRLPTTICWPQVGLDGFEPACLKLCFVIESVSRRAFS